ncbi:MAG: carboxymuconolactone decarboxylase family protein, partial [Alphaproteobacteria bacterium]|nr:carboxymuconolactone decarboxylase family protein [Alphaproteobacteria bacterium]
MTDAGPTGSAHIEPLPLDALAEVEDVISVARQASGYVPTSMRIMAHKPDILRAFGGLIGAIMRTETELPMQMKWLVAHAVSTSAGCVYCQAHTAANGGKKGLAVEKSQEILNYRDSPLFSDAERAVIEFGLAAGEVP